MTDLQSPPSSFTLYFWQDTQITQQQYERLWRYGMRHELRKEIRS